MNPFGLQGYEELSKLTENTYRTVSVLKWRSDGRKYAAKVYNKAKLMQNKAMVQNVLNEK